MDISVVIPTYRRPQLLAMCLSALCDQDFEGSYEIIVVSDGPDSSASDMIKNFKHGERVRFIEMPVKKGPAAARNYGWRRACSDLIAFTDDDTKPASNWLSAYWLAWGGKERIAFTGKVIVPLPDNPTDYEKNTAGLETAEFVTANCCCTRLALEQAGGFDERFSMAWREDSDLHFKLMMEGIPIINIAAAVVIHPVRSAGWGISLKEQRKGRFNALLYKKFPSLYRQRIQPYPMWDYYIMVMAPAFFITGLLTDHPWLPLFSFSAWAVLLVRFIWRRLKTTSKSLSHVLEMIVTSACIPFLSVYWQLYGAFKYNVAFL
jgi:GT2 family glycosyltransferase